MVDPVGRDSRGILQPGAGLQRFSLRRHAPSPAVARFVDRYWIVEWDLPEGEQHTQEILVHPVANVVFGDGPARLSGVRRTRFARTLEGRGMVLGTMFRPAGFSPFSDRPMAALTDVELDLDEVLGPDATALAAAVDAAPDDEAMVAVVDGFWAARVPPHRLRSENVTELADKVVADPHLSRVDDLAALAGCTVRQLQRLFAEHVGTSPKWVIRRYRLYDAAERAARDPDLDWATVAAELGYADQAHLTRDFTAAVGLPPARYAASCRAAASTLPADAVAAVGSAP
ncbi:AraC family transcriptional regulator [Aquihabitans sp. G128]|uniref:helix-turn-helix domain-containing protein n=1 Tax=Aquihabitans sp. G128 TaxID=2849779 RepID=UPI001C22E2BF|nr:AraC family transcriptional regulator [Aquihabitans sp. G128]QXC60117.1 AraC family transcriptional regulator [Aquihabitans sp. G128]